MTGPAYEDILRQIASLPLVEQLRLIARLAERLCSRHGMDTGGPRWEDYAGSAPHPLCGQDAQDWVSRTRQESDEARNA